MFSLLLLFFLVSSIFVTKEIRNLTSQVDKLLIQKDFDRSIKLLETKIKNYWLGTNVLYAKLLLLITYLVAANNSLAKKLLNQTKWHKYRKNVLYIQILFELEEGNITRAKVLHEKLAKTKNQTLIQYKIMSERLIEFVEHGKPNKDIIKTSTYPIEQKIYEKYAIKNPIT